MVEATSLNSWNVFGDSTVHVREGASAIRALRVDSAFIFAGDLVRYTGTVSTLDGQPCWIRSRPSLWLHSRRHHRLRSRPTLRGLRLVDDWTLTWSQ